MGGGMVLKGEGLGDNLKKSSRDKQIVVLKCSKLGLPKSLSKSVSQINGQGVYTDGSKLIPY